MTDGLLLREAGVRQVTCIVRERQLRLYGHVARLPVEYLAYRILFWRQVESYLKNAGMASAWSMARRRPKEYRRKVDSATRCSGVCPRT